MMERRHNDRLIMERRSFVKAAGGILVSAGFWSCGDSGGPGGDDDTGMGVLPDIYGHGFDDGTAGQFTNGAGSSPIGNGWVLDSSTAATGSNSIRQDYPQRNSNLGVAFFYDLPSSRQAFYIRFAYRQASGWPNNDDMKVQRVQASNKNGQFGSFLIRGGSSNFWYFWDDLEPTTVLNPNVNLPAPTANELRGEWHWYEIYRDISVDGQLVVKIWIDDVLYFDYVTNAGNQGVTYRRLQFDGTVNSLSNASSAWFDEIGISSTKMGIPAGAPGQQ